MLERFAPDYDLQADELPPGGLWLWRLRGGAAGVQAARAGCERQRERTPSPATNAGDARKVKEHQCFRTPTWKGTAVKVFTGADIADIAPTSFEPAIAG